ncbi:MAG: XRE family transcriptional regulator [Pseudomonadales bacterium]
MNKEQTFNSVWDALEDDPIKAENMKLRSALMMAITERIEVENLNQTEVAKRLGITQPRVSALAKGKIGEFRLDTLVNLAHQMGLHVSMQVAA